jgi:Phage ABA sandwich domain
MLLSYQWTQNCFLYYSYTMGIGYGNDIRTTSYRISNPYGNPTTSYYKSPHASIMTNDELNIAIATSVFKLAILHKNNSSGIVGPDNTILEIPKYSEDLNSAHVIIDTMKQKNLSYSISANIDQIQVVTTWRCTIRKDGVELASVVENTMPRAICVATTKVI